MITPSESSLRSGSDRDPEKLTGHFYGVGLGPGDPELVTLKAARLIASADVVAFHAGVGKQSNARRIAADLIPEGAVEEELRYPVTTGSTEHPGGYAGAMAEFYEASAARLAVHLEAGRTVVLLAEGDPLFYGSYMYMHDRLSERFPTEVVPGVPAFAAATAAVASPLVRQTDVLTILPGTLPEPELARRLADTDGAIIMKLGRTFPAVRSALEQAGRLDHAMYVERASMPEERWLPVADVDPATVPYFSLIVVARRLAARGRTTCGLVPNRKHIHRRQAVCDQSWGARAAGRGARPRAGRVGHAGGVGGAGGGRPRGRVRGVRQPGAAAGRPDPARVGQHRRARPGPAGPRPRGPRGEGRRRVRRRRRGVRDGVGGLRGGRGPGVRRCRDPGAAGAQRGPGRRRPGRRADRGDFAVVSLSDRLKPWPVVEQRLRAIAEADLVLAIYNPASRSRTEQIVRAQKLLLEHRAADTVVVVGRDVGREEESLTVTTLAALDAESIDMKCLLIVGASSTRQAPSGAVWTPRFVDRSRAGS